MYKLKSEAKWIRADKPQPSEKSLPDFFWLISKIFQPEKLTELSRKGKKQEISRWPPKDK